MILNYITWNIDPVIFSIGDFTLRWYSLLMATGFILGYLAIRKIFIKEGIPPRMLETFGIYIVLGMFIGGRLVHCLFYEPDYYLAHPIEIIKPWRGQLGNGAVYTGFNGMASHGGILGVIIGLAINARRQKIPVLWIFDRFAIVLAIAGFFIRMGNLFNSEILGIETAMPWGFIFERVSRIPRHPAQLYEALTYLAIFLFTGKYYLVKQKTLKNGELLGLTLILVFLSRFFLEFIKEGQTASDSHTFFNMGQLLSIPFFLIGISLFIYKKFSPKKKLM